MNRSHTRQQMETRVPRAGGVVEVGGLLRSMVLRTEANVLESDSGDACMTLGT